MAAVSANTDDYARRDRQLGWVTADRQRFPSLEAEDWQDAIRQGLCPFCGSGPFIVVAIHVSKLHGIDRRTFRDWLGVSANTSICDETHSAACAAKAKVRSAEWWSDGTLAAVVERRVAKATARTEAMHALYEQGFTMREIAERTGFAYNTVRNWMHRLGLITDGHAPGSPADAKRRQKRGPEPQRRTSHCRNGHERTPENTYITHRGMQSCRECARANDRKRPSGSVRQRLAREKAHNREGVAL